MRNEYEKKRRSGQSPKWLIGMIIVVGLIGLGPILLFR